ncbi:G-protein coupled receptor Mth2-like [Hetaerina americana]|uniref:G-protein coupled receptor Mth2-like n=1 Tax=Hetaerina americana TaxID=62018 RepID=UPI003A7F2D90
MCRTASLIHVAAFLLVTSARGTSSGACSPWLSVNITNAIIFSNDTAWDPDDDVLYPPDTYWTTPVDGGIHVYGCPCRLDRPCLRKCCNKYEAMDKDTQECTPVKRRWPWFRPTLIGDEDLTVRIADTNEFGLLYGTFCVGYLLEPEKFPEDLFILNFTDGTLSIPARKKTGIDSMGFCLEYLPREDIYLPYVCLKDIFSDSSSEYCEELREIIYPLGMSISIFFLLIALTVYSITPELRNLHGKCLICHILSLLGAYLIHLTSRAIRNDLSNTVCRAIGFVVYYGLLSSFLWLNAICIDVCIAFRNLRPTRRLHDESEGKKFLYYLLYAWGVPLVIIIITAGLAFHPALTDSFLGPEFRTICGYYRGKSRLFYFVVPMGLIVLFNIVLFTVTTFNIRKITRQTSILNGEGNWMNRADKDRINLFLKLLIVMGVSWVFGSWVLELLNYFYGSTSCMWLFTDTMNAMQGVFIFIIFVCKNNVKKLMRKRMRRIVSLVTPNVPICLQNMDGAGETTTSASTPHTPRSAAIRWQGNKGTSY